MAVVYLFIGLAILWGLGWISRNKPPRPKNSISSSKAQRLPAITVRLSPRQDTVLDDTSYDLDDTMYDIKPPFPVKATLYIHYTDSKGDTTERTVDVFEVGAGMYNNVLVGRCRMRNAVRTFYLHRIQSCCDDETGEVVDDIYGYLRKKYDESPERTVAELLSNEYDALRILLYVGKADNVLRAAERVIIREACRALSQDSRISDGMIDTLFKDVQLFTENAFQAAVRRLAKRSPEIRSLILDASVRMVATDKKVYPAEQAALDYMKKKWERSE